ncbi:MAG TPA: dTDP-glucose 4,6-dehydratase [Bacillota bacterium]
MKTILVTGGAGFIGSNFIHYLLGNYPEYKVINLDLLTYAGNLENLKDLAGHDNYRFIQGDISSSATLEAIFKANSIDYVVNFAAETHVDRSIREPEIFVRTNVLGTANLLNVARKYWVNRDDSYGGNKFIQISTDEVYGSLSAKGFFTEDTPYNPCSPYSASKAGADLLAQSFYATYGFPVVITRCGNNYGPYQFPEKLIPLMINNALQKKPLPVYGDGLQIRDWLYVEDHCAAITLVLQKGKIGTVYNIGGRNEQTNLQVVKTIIHYLQKHVDPLITVELIKHVADRPGHDRRYGIDPTKIQTELGWSAQTPFHIGIEKTIRWYLEHQEWLKNVTSGEYQRYYQKVYGGLEQ